MQSRHCKFTFPARYAFVLLSFLGILVLYALRVNLSVAIVSMVGSQAANKTAVCPNGDNQIKNLTKGEIEWSREQRDQIAMYFFIGYMIFQIPAGNIAENYGSKSILFVSILGTSILTLLSPLMARSGFIFFAICRVLEGMFEGCFYPSMHAMVANWLPLSERGFLSTIIYSGAQIGTVLTSVFSGLFIKAGLFGGWPSAFYIFGMAGIFWCVIWFFLVYEKPQNHPRISPEELNFIESSRGPEKKNMSTPWIKIFTSVKVWALVAAHFGHNWGFYTLLLELPTYFQNVLGLDIAKNGLLSGIPYFLQAIVGWLVSYLFDILIRNKKMKVNTVRKLSNTIGMLGPAVCLFSLTFVRCNYDLNIALLFMAVSLTGFTYSGFNVTHVDMSPDYAGTLMGMTNCLANLPGILTPLLVSFINRNGDTIESWSLIFYISCVMYVTCSMIFVVFGSAELQPWGLAEMNVDTNPEKALRSDKEDKKVDYGSN